MKNRAHHFSISLMAIIVVALCIITLFTEASLRPRLAPNVLQASLPALPGPQSSATVTVSANGTYTIRFTNPGFTFSGRTPHAPGSIATTSGRDGVGPYQETSFSYLASVGQRGGAIRAYIGKPVVLFIDSYQNAAPNTQRFPDFSNFPQTPYHLSYDTLFAKQSFDLQGTGGPLVFFNGQAQAAIMSSASHFMEATTEVANGQLSSGIDRRIGTLPAGFGQATILAAGQGIGATFDTWGHALTDLQGKTRPSNQADTLLKYLSYWTDAGAEYYYHFDPGAGSYPATLLAIKNEYDQKNVPIKSMQIDSWWYPKGWDNGMLSYTADPNIWTTDDPTVNGTAELQNFQRQLNLPTIFHARWVSDYSPYFGQYAMSGHVSIDPAYWKNAMDYIKALGATTYEQDWLDIKATPDFNLSDPETFMDTMAAAARADGLNLQYCMEVPDQVLQGTKYNNLLTMRTSIDRFDRNRWEPDLWTSQLAKAVGTWPWVDNFRSSETNNLLLADLSAGPVGPGDALGTVDAANLQKVIRADSEIVKPDQPLVPTDATYINDAAGHTDQPFIASTFTDFGTSKAEYVAAFPRPYGTLQTANFKPSDFGFTGNVYIYDYFTGQGEVARAASVFTDKIDTLHYYIIVPIGPSGVALLGDQSKFVSLGKQRVTSLTDNGTLEASLTFAPNDPPVTLRGYSPTKPTIRASQGKLDSFVYDTKSHTFAITIKPSSQYMAKISLSLKPPIKAPAKRFLPTFLLTTHPR